MVDGGRDVNRLVANPNTWLGSVCLALLTVGSARLSSFSFLSLVGKERPRTL